MENTKRVLWTLGGTVLLFGIGLVSGWLMLAAPVYMGLLAMALLLLSLWLGPVAGLAGALGFCVGLTVFGSLFTPWMWAAAIWLYILLAGLVLLIQGQFRKKLPLVKTMLYTAIAAFLYGAATYIVCTLIFGDLVTRLMELMRQSFETMHTAFPEFLDYYLSTGSLLGTLADVGLTQPSTALTDEVRATLQNSLIEVLDYNVRIKVMGELVKYALQIAFLGTLIPAMVYNRRGKGEEISPLPDLTAVRIPVKTNMVLMLTVLALWVGVLLSENLLAVYTAGWNVIQFIYAVQGLSLAEWFLKKHGWSRGARYTVMAAVYLLLPFVLFILGFLEQIFYFRGIGRPTPKDFGIKDDRDDQ